MTANNNIPPQQPPTNTHTYARNLALASLASLISGLSYCAGVLMTRWSSLWPRMELRMKKIMTM
ncbi:hypothetical protein IAQ61_008985 [Plenodomus lingam]|uniref:uncharacterized protein n=1 Tax=Leptosphaeria maculans TaxID=5022 RepID=UPI00332A2881|nr:hypothetical protein IAQ61_008985 [Plenodomus lingam]